MQIKVTDRDFILTLSDEQLDNDAFVDLTLVSPDGESMTCTMPIADLMPALIAFDAKRSRRLSDEASMA